MTDKKTLCPCKSGKPFKECCRPKYLRYSDGCHVCQEVLAAMDEGRVATIEGKEWDPAKDVLLIAGLAQLPRERPC